MKKITLTVDCEWCAGTGVQPASATHLVPCDECQGSGFEVQVSWNEDHDHAFIADLYVGEMTYA